MGSPTLSVSPDVNAEGYANGGVTAREAGITYYRLVKLAALGQVRSKVNPFGHLLFSIEDARKFAGRPARA